MGEVYEAKVDVSLNKVPQATNAIKKKSYQAATSIQENQEDVLNPEDFYDDKSQKKESREKEKNPEFEKNNYKIDTGLTQEQKEKMNIGETLNGWKKEISTALINGKIEDILILKKQIAGPYPDAFVREYINYDNMLKDATMPKYLVGEQLFNSNAVTNLGLRNKVPSSDDIEAMGGLKENDQDFGKNNFQKDGEILLPGYRDPNQEGFPGVGRFARFWLSDGGSALQINTNGTTTWVAGNNAGLSLRFLKQK